jgi:hypothetical protein
MGQLLSMDAHSNERLRLQAQVARQAADCAAAEEQDLVSACAWCGRYRNSEGNWNVAADDALAEASLTHVICGDCAQTHFGVSS